MLRLAASAVVALLFSGSAFAQNAVYDWSGVYVGGNGGFGWGLDDTIEFTYTPACVPAATCPTTVSVNPEGFVAGGQLGANWQHDMWVLGIEGDADWTDIGDRGSTFVAAGPTTVAASTDLDWLATIRGRAGIAANRGLIYATGGFAFGGVDNEAALTSTATVIRNITITSLWRGAESGTETGWTAGGGFEFAATKNLIIGAEALYVDLGDNTVRLATTPPVASPVIRAHFENEYVIIRGRIGWKW